MIKSIKDKETRKVWNGHISRRLPREIHERASAKMQILDATTTLDELITPGNNFEKMGGKRKGQLSIRINDQWRICFNWIDGHAENVEITDYHK